MECQTMCHHRDLEYERLYEDAEERKELPDWANEPKPDSEAEDDPDESEKPIAPSVADD